MCMGCAITADREPEANAIGAGEDDVIEMLPVDPEMGRLVEYMDDIRRKIAAAFGFGWRL